jgi:hypothetical protein
VRVKRSIWSVSMGLAILASVLIATVSAVANSSGNIRIQGTSINGKLAVMNRTDLTGSFNTGCLDYSPAPTEGQVFNVDVASPRYPSGWETPEQHTFLLSAANGKQRLTEYVYGRDPRDLFVTVTEETSCQGLHTWVITFTEEHGGAVVID